VNTLENSVDESRKQQVSVSSDMWLRSPRTDSEPFSFVCEILSCR